MCLKTDTILLQYTLYQFQYFITTCLCTVGIYQGIFQSNSFNGIDLMVLFNWDWTHLSNKLSLTLNVPIPDRVKKLNLNFYFHASLWCLKRF